jgi:hypothetical protein
MIRIMMSSRDITHRQHKRIAYTIRERKSPPVAPANMVSPRIFLPMPRRTGNASRNVTSTIEIEPALYFPVDHVAHESGFASFLGCGTTP